MRRRIAIVGGGVSGLVADALLRYPCVTLKTITAIHVEAARLYLKGIPFLSHPGETAAQRRQRALLDALTSEGRQEHAPAGPREGVS